MKKIVLILAVSLSGCTVTPGQDTPTRARIAESSLPPMKSFARPRPAVPAMSNANIAADFMSLHFQLESGRDLPTFTRFETPITVRVTGKPPASLNADLRRLLDRLRTEARIDIREVSDGTANVTIEAVSRGDIRRVLPDAACFVVPNVSSLAEFRRDRRKPKTNWSELEKRERLGIFLPYDASPQEVRDCLHEELAQALGPLNDLYRLPQSVFNDDNVHTVLTGFDMLILRVTYAPELKSGMNYDQVASRLPAILNRLNPSGRSVPKRQVGPTPRSWVKNVQTALGPGASASARRNAAASALITAQSQGWTDHRRAFSHYLVGRMTQPVNPAEAQKHFSAAFSYLERTPGTDLHRAYITTQTAAYAILRGDGASALRQIEPSIEAARQGENAALLATLMLLKAEALELNGKTDAARTVRLDSLGWARYGFGSDWAVRAKMKEIAGLNPGRRRKAEL